MGVFSLENLFDINVGQNCKILEILTDNQIKRRLIDIGLAPDCIVKCVGKSPLGDPKAFLIGGAVIALRKEICEKIKVGALQ